MTKLAPHPHVPSQWQGRLDLHYTHDTQHGTRLRHRHDGPMRVFKSLYPEGPDCCHTVLIHPPGGLVGGDRLDIDIQLDAKAHALISTPGAARFYATDDLAAHQSVRLQLAAGARLEWCPLETLAYPGCRAENHWQASMAPGSELIAWDLVALGLPAAQQAFTHGQYQQHMAIDGLWLERAHIDARDQRLMGGRLGLNGHRALVTMVYASGDALTPQRQNQLLEAAREVLPPASAAHSDAALLAVTCPNRHMVVLRGLAAQTEPLMQACQRVWAVWRSHAWGLHQDAPRIWRV